MWLWGCQMAFMISRISKVDDYKYCNRNLAITKERSGAKLRQAEATRGIAIIPLLLVIVGTGEPGASFMLPGENAAAIDKVDISKRCIS